MQKLRAHKRRHCHRDQIRVRKAHVNVSCPYLTQERFAFLIQVHERLMARPMVD